MRWLLIALVVLIAGCAPAATPAARSEPIDWSDLVGRPSQYATAMPPPAPATLPPLPSGALDAWCGDPAVDEAQRAVFDTENAHYAEIQRVVEGETFAERQARVLAVIETRPERVAAARAALEKAYASRPLPPGWHGPGARSVLDLLCSTREGTPR